MEVEDLNFKNPVGIGYYDPFNVFSHIKNEIEEKFPLTNLHWKYSPSKPLKSIPVLPIALISEKGELQNVYAKIMFAKFDNLDMYRAQVRPLIKEWLKNCLKNNVEWMIIFYVLLNSKDKLSTLIKTSAFDKLKVDFGIHGKELTALGIQQDGRERIFKLKEKYETNLDKLESYNLLTVQLKQILISTFDNKYNFLSNTSSLVNLESMLVKLRLANCLNDMRLLLESLEVFDELSNMLNQFYNKFPHSFLTNAALPEDLSDYNFESCFDLERVEKGIFATGDEKINLFDFKCYLFIKQSILLQSLANLASTVSISSIFLSRLYQNLICFLNDLSDLVSKNIDEFIYVVLDNYLNLPMCNKLMKTYKQYNEGSDDPVYQLNEILEFHGELKLFQRSKMVGIAQTKGYYINGITDVLEDVPLHEVKKAKNDTILTYKPLLKDLSSEKDYLKAFERITESAIHDFLTSGRSKTIDVLSIDLALLHFQMKEYEKSLNILQNSHKFFISNGWHYMGGVLLEVFLVCVEKTQPGNDKLILITILDLMSNVLTSHGKLGINNYNSLRKRPHLLKLVEKLRKHSESLNEKIEYSLKSLFGILIEPQIFEDTSPVDRYYLRIALTNPYNIPINYKDFTLEVSNKEGEMLKFTSRDFQILEEEHSIIKLYSNDFVLGIFWPFKLIMQVNENLIFSLGFLDPMANIKNAYHIDSVLHNKSIDYSDASVNETLEADDQFESKSLTYYQNLDKFWCEYLVPNEIELGKTECLLRIHNGSVSSQDLKIEFSSLSQEVVILKEKLKAGVEKLEPKEVFDIKVPYSSSSDNKIINMRAEISYKANDEEYTHVFIAEVDTTLRISVVVQDIFKPNFIYSKFQVGSSNPKFPIRVISNDLKSNNSNYFIKVPKNDLHSAVAFGDQPVSLFYMIIPEKGYSIRSNDAFKLILEYSNLQDECTKHLRELLLERLVTSNLKSYWFLLMNFLKDLLKFDLNKYAIYDTIEIVNNHEIELFIEKMVSENVWKKDDHKKLLDIMKDILFTSMKVENSYRGKRKLFITVPIPILNYLQVTEFKYERKGQYLVGEPIPMKLTVETVTKWGPKEESESSFQVEDVSILAESSPKRLSPNLDSVKQSFQIIIQTDDSWLISGFRKQTFELSVTEGNFHEFDLILIPLSVGKLTLPKITIKSSDAVKGRSIDYLFVNGSETLLVVPELNSLTFSF